MKFKNKAPFTRYHLKKQRDSFTVNLNKEERLELNECKRILEQAKDSTAIKILATIGAKEIQRQKMAYVLGVVFKNKRNNERQGITEIE